MLTLWSSKNFPIYLWGYGRKEYTMKFPFWCQKVLPLVYDDSLSYYEVLCKVYDFLNHIINDNTEVIKEVEELEKEVAQIKEWIDNFDTSYAEQIIQQYLASMLYLGISDAGYIIYYIPEGWKDIQFNTTDLDITDEMLSGNGHLTDYEYGRLVLSMYVNN